MFTEDNSALDCSDSITFTSMRGCVPTTEYS